MRYAAVQTAVWQSGDFRNLSHNAQFLWLYLLTSPHSNMIGYYWLPLSYIAHDTQLTEDAIVESLMQLEDTNIATYSYESSTVLITNHLKWNKLSGVNGIKAAVRVALSVPRGVLWPQFLAEAKRHTGLQVWDELLAAPPEQEGGAPLEGGRTPFVPPSIPILQNPPGTVSGTGTGTVSGTGTDIGAVDTTPSHREISADARTLATALYDALKAQGALPTQNGWFMRQAGIAEHVLLPVRSLAEWLECLQWALADEFWRQRLTNLAQLGDKVWPQYARRQQRSRAADSLAEWLVRE